MKYQQIDVNIKSEFIKLDSLLKYAGVVETGGIVPAGWYSTGNGYQEYR